MPPPWISIISFPFSQLNRAENPYLFPWEKPEKNHALSHVVEPNPSESPPLRKKTEAARTEEESSGWQQQKKR